MDKQADITRLPAKGGFDLFLGMAMSTLINAVGVILVVRLLGPSQYGVYTIALVFPVFICLFGDWGSSQVMIKLLARYKNEDKKREIRSILASGILIQVVLGTSLFFLSYSLAGPLSNNLFNRPEIKSLIEIASITVLASALLNASHSIFVGLEKTRFSSLTMILHSSLKAIIIPALIFLGLDTYGAVIGYTLAFLAAGILGISIVYVAIYRKNGKTEGECVGVTLKNMIKLGIPLHLSTFQLLPVYTLIAAVYCDNYSIGNYQAAVNFAAYLTFFTTPISTLMFPVFSRLDPVLDQKKLITVFRSSVKYAALLSTPVAMATMVLSKPLVSMLFGSGYVEASLFLTLYSVYYLYPAFGSLSLSNFLTGQGRTGVSTVLALITVLVGIPLSLLLISNFRILGLMATMLVSALPGLATGLWWAKNHYGIGIEWFSSAKILLSAGVTAALTYLLIEQINLIQWVSLEVQNWFQHILGGAFFISGYIALVYLMGVVQKSDINNLKEILGPASILFDVPFRITKKSARAMTSGGG